MGPKRLPKRSIFVVAALFMVLLAAPAALAQGGSYNQVTLNIFNATTSQITIRGAMITQGEWVQGRQPIPGTQYPAEATAGPFATFSPVVGEGNGGSLYLNLGIITWEMPWNGQPQIEVKLGGAGMQSQVNGPLADPDQRHVVYNITISKQ